MLLKISSKAAFFGLFLSYAVVLAPLVDENNRNYLVLIGALLGTLCIAIYRLRVARDFLITTLLFMYLATVALVNGPTIDFFSACMTAFLALGYISIAGFRGKAWFTHSNILAIFAFVIVAFASLSFAQMLASLTGIPAPNLMASKGLWSYNSLAIEPSHLGRVVGITMLGYLIVARLDRPKASLIEIVALHRWVVLAFILTMILSGSALSAVAILLVFLLANSIPWTMLVGFILVMLWPLAVYVDYEPLQRSIRLISSLPSMDVETVFRSEGSGAIRIIPALIYMEILNPSNAQWWFGQGSEGLTEHFLGRIPSLRHAGSAGFFPGFAVFYGLVGFGLLFWSYILRFANWITAPIILFWTIFFFSVAWNIQLFWYGILIIRVVYELGVIKHPSKSVKAP